MRHSGSGFCRKWDMSTILPGRIVVFAQKNTILGIQRSAVGEFLSNQAANPEQQILVIAH